MKKSRFKYRDIGGKIRIAKIGDEIKVGTFYGYDIMRKVKRDGILGRKYLKPRKLKKVI
jgi:hypothetical protein